MNKHAYIILAHKNIQQIQLLINVLDEEYNDIFLHIDKKCSCEHSFLTTQKARLYVFSKYDVRWGTYSIVECELFLLERAVEKNYSYYHLLSGEDFPIKKARDIYNFFESTQKEFVSFTNSRITKCDLSRVQFKHPFLNLMKTNNNQVLNRVYFKIDSYIMRIFRIIGRKGVLYFDEYQKGSQWFSITHNFAVFVCNQKTIIEKSFSKTIIPDEMFIQTLLVNSSFKVNANEISQYNSCIQNSRLIDWERGAPYIFTKDDIAELMQSSCCFARKISFELALELSEYLKGI